MGFWKISFRKELSFLLRLCHESLDLIRLADHICRQNLAPILADQQIILDPDADFPLVNVQAGFVGDHGAGLQRLVPSPALTS